MIKANTSTAPVYEYEGFTFRPVRTLNKRERKMPLGKFSAFLGGVESYVSSVFTRYDGGTYSYESFYNSMQNDPADIFHCEETGSDYIPAQNQLFIWKGGVA